jgi:hypothetical protein
MKFLARLFFVLLLLGNLSFMAALSLHVVRSPGKWAVVTKGQVTLQEWYVDTRNWTTADLREHASAAHDISMAGKGELLAHVGSAAASVTPHDIALPQPQQPSNAKTDSPEPASKTIFDFSK